MTVYEEPHLALLGRYSGVLRPGWTRCLTPLGNNAAGLFEMRYERLQAAKTS